MAKKLSDMINDMIDSESPNNFEWCRMGLIIPVQIKPHAHQERVLDLLQERIQAQARGVRDKMKVY